MTEVIVFAAKEALGDAARASVIKSWKKRGAKGAKRIVGFFCLVSTSTFYFRPPNYKAQEIYAQLASALKRVIRDPWVALVT